MSSMFLHTEAYAPTSIGRKRNLYGVIGEACRHVGFHPHVPNPLEPTLVFGVHPRDLLPLIEELRSVGTDCGRRKIPKTFPLLVGAVASIPVKPDEFDRDPAVRNWVEAWIELNIKFLCAEFGLALKSVILHRDELYIHLHGFALPTPDPVTMAVTVETVWQPFAAQGLARRQGGDWSVQREKFTAAATQCQDRYYLMVGEPANLDRFGPEMDRRRLERHAHLARREAKQVAIEEANAREVERQRRARDRALKIEAANEIIALRAEVARLAEIIRQGRLDPSGP